MVRRLTRLLAGLAPRRGRLPHDVAAALHLATGEHVIAHAPTAEGHIAVATDRALYVPVAEHVPVAGSWCRVGWEAVARATWEGDVLHVVEAGGPGESPPRHALTLLRPGLLPDAVHDRVTSTIVVSRHVPVRGKAGVRIIGRRTPGRRGESALTWSMAFDPGIDAADPDVRAAAGAALDDLRTQLGL